MHLSIRLQAQLCAQGQSPAILHNAAADVCIVALPIMCGGVCSWALQGIRRHLVTFLHAKATSMSCMIGHPAYNAGASRTHQSHVPHDPVSAARLL